MTKGLPERESDDAKAGTLFHGATAGDEKAFAQLDAEDQELVSKCQDFALSKLPQDHNVKVMEVERWVSLKRGQEIVTSGWLDLVAVNDTVAYVFDWKSGRAPLSERSATLQLAAYSGGVMQEFGVSKVLAWAYQPRLGVEYHAEFTSLEAIIQTVERVIAASNNPDAPLNPSLEACQYCRALPVCEAAREAGMNAIQVAEKFSVPAKATEAASLLERIAHAEEVFATVKAEIKQHAIENKGFAVELEEAGYKLTGRRGNPFVTDAQAAVDEFVEDLGVEEIRKLLSMNYAALRTLYLESVKEGTVKERQERFERRAASFTARAKDIQYLRRVARKEQK